MRPLPLSGFSVLTLVVAAAALPAAADVYSFTPIPGFAGDPYSTHALNVSPDGSIVVGEVYNTNGWDGFRWSTGTGIIGMGRGSTRAVSADNSIIVGTAVGSSPGRWTAATGWTSLGAFPGLTNSFGNSFACSRSGSIIVGYGQMSSTYPQRAFRWTGGPGIEALALPQVIDRTFATAVSDDGSVIYGEMNLNNVYQACRWVGSGQAELLTGANLQYTQDATPDGSIAVGTVAGTPFAGFRWSVATGALMIPQLRPNSSGAANGISADGSIVVGVSTSSGGNRAYVWDALRGTRDLNTVLPALGVNLNGWLLTQANGVSDDGRTVVGIGINQLGIEQGWVATIPEPGALVPLWALVIGLAKRRRRM